MMRFAVGAVVGAIAAAAAYVWWVLRPIAIHVDELGEPWGDL